jgi:hypothetical protein
MFRELPNHRGDHPVERVVHRALGFLGVEHVAVLLGDAGHRRRRHGLQRARHVPEPAVRRHLGDDRGRSERQRVYRARPVAIRRRRRSRVRGDFRGAREIRRRDLPLHLHEPREARAEAQTRTPPAFGRGDAHALALEARARARAARHLALGIPGLACPGISQVAPPRAQLALRPPGFLRLQVREFARKVRARRVEQRTRVSETQPRAFETPRRGFRGTRSPHVQTLPTLLVQKPRLQLRLLPAQR